MNTHRPVLLALVLSVVPVSAWGQPAARDPAKATQLFKEAVEQSKAGDWAGACPKFETSQRLDPSPGTLINIAMCHEHHGKLVTALSDLQQALELNSTTADEQRRQTLENYAKKLLQKIEAKLPKLTIVVREAPAGLQVQHDGVDVPAAKLGQALPADPGPHVVEASAPGYHPERHPVSLAEGGQETVEIRLLRKPPLPPPPAPVVTPPVAPPKPGTSGRRIGAYVAFGAGAAGAVVGAVTGGLMLSKKATMSSDCGTPKNGVVTCKSDDGIAAGNAAKTMGLAATLGWSAALAGAALGVVLVATEPRRKPSQQAQWKLDVSVSGPSLSIEGAW